MIAADPISLERAIRRAANWGIGIGIVKVISSVYLLLLPSFIGSELYSLIPIAVAEILFTFAVGVAFVVLGLKVKGNMRASGDCLLIVLVMSAVGMFLSLITASGGKMFLDGITFVLYWHARKAQKRLITENT